MAFMTAAMWMSAASTAVTVISTAQQASAQADAAEYAAESDARRMEFNAKQEEERGKAEYAKATRQAQIEERRGRILESDAAAAAAAGGGSASDAGAIRRVAGIGAETEYNVLSTMFEGETAKQGADTRASLLRTDAQRTRQEGSMTSSTIRSNARTQGLSTVLAGGSKMYRSYKAQQPGKSSWVNPNNSRVMRY
jgi:hypothetical protein